MDRWVASYQTLRFDTPNGSLKDNEYAEAGIGKGGVPIYWLRVPDSIRKLGGIVGNIFTTSNTALVINKDKVGIVGNIVFNDFVDDFDNLSSDEGTQDKLDKMRLIKGEPLPVKIKKVAK